MQGKSQRAFAGIVLAGLLLTGCGSVIPLDAPVILNGEVQVTDCAGTPRPLGNPEAGDYLAAGTFAETGGGAKRPVGDPDCTGERNRELRLGLAVRPGTVLHLATPTMGAGIGPPQSPLQGNLSSYTKLEVGAHQPQLAGRLRLPVRLIGDDQRLTPDETFVLATILSLHRSKNFGGGENYANTAVRWRWLLERHKVTLWNALVGSLQVRRIVQSVANPFLAEKGNAAILVSTLALVIEPSQFCKLINDKLEADRSNVPDSELTALKAGVLIFNCASSKAVEAFALFRDAHRASGLSATVALQDAKNAGQGFFLDNRIFAPASFVSAELDAVRLANSEGTEREWSLTEWEHSGICNLDRRERKIERLRLRANPVWFRVVPDGEEPTHRVKAIITQGVNFRGIHAVEPARLVLAPTIPRQDLALLRSVDVDGIAWDATPETMKVDPCRL